MQVNRGHMCLLAIVCLPLAAARAAETRREKEAAAKASTEQVLRDEAKQPLDRRARLDELIARSPEAAALRWHAGYVWDGELWRPFETVPASTGDLETVELYRTLRDAAKLTPERHLELADWCRKHKLPDQERAHLTALLDTASAAEQALLLTRMGYQQVFGQWLSQRQLADWSRHLARSQASLQKWGPKLDKFSEQLAGSARQHETALRGLREIETPDVIPALELAWTAKDEPNGLLVVRTLTQIPDYEAAVALARQAVFSNWESVRTAAAEALRARRFEEYVPDLLDLLVAVDVNTDFQSHFETIRGRRHGTLLYTFIMTRETRNQIEVSSLQTTVALVNGALSSSSTNARVQTPATRADMRREYDRARVASENAYRRSLQAEEAKEWSAEMNKRVAGVLGEVSGAEATTDPRFWWGWWAETNDTTVPEKRVVRVEESQRAGTRASASCFAAGTPVWTETGLVPIEEIRLGDRVLSQDAESGELSYRPVLQTVPGPPREMRTLTIGGEKLTATRGHRFWVSGAGWLMAKELQPDALLHTATGTLPLEAIVSAPAEPTFNLVVADANSYFVGRTAVLSHDVTIPRPTNRVVPGLAGR